MKTRILTAFVLLVDLAAIALVWISPAAGPLEQPSAFLILALLAGLMGVRPVIFKGTQLAPTHPFILAALAVLGPLAAGLVGVVGVIGTSFSGGRRPTTRRFAFNVGAIFLAVFAASWMFRVLGGGTGEGLISTLKPLAAAAAIYFVVNTGLVGAAMALERSEHFLKIWRASFSWTAVPFFAGVPVAVALLAVLETSVFWTIALSLPPCWLILSYYRTRAEGVMVRPLV